MERSWCRAVLAGALLLGAASQGHAQGLVPVEADDEPERDLATVDLEALLDTRIDRLTVPGVGHTHQAGELMVGYSLRYVEMEGLRDRTEAVAPEEVLRDPMAGGQYGFPVTPTRMSMTMHMLHLMWAPHELLTLMAMGHAMAMDMDHRTRGGVEFVTESAGLGDTLLAALVNIVRTGEHRLHATAGVSLPTGTIDARDDLPAGDDLRLPYPMQLGSGTFDPLLAVTYRGLTESVGWGAKGEALLRLYDNANDYHRGNLFRLSLWASVAWSELVSTYLRLRGEWSGAIRGADPALNPSMVPTADPDLHGGRLVEAQLALALDGEDDLAGLRLEMSAGAPIYQRLNGPQLETDLAVELALIYVAAP